MTLEQKTVPDFSIVYHWTGNKSRIFKLNASGTCIPLEQKIATDFSNHYASGAELFCLWCCSALFLILFLQHSELHVLLSLV
jgi:hypothetical protein